MKLLAFAAGSAFVGALVVIGLEIVSAATGIGRQIRADAVWLGVLCGVVGACIVKVSQRKQVEEAIVNAAERTHRERRQSAQRLRRWASWRQDKLWRVAVVMQDGREVCGAWAKPWDAEREREQIEETLAAGSLPDFEWLAGLNPDGIVEVRTERDQAS